VSKHILFYCRSNEHSSYVHVHCLSSSQAIKELGQTKFDRIHDYLLRQRASQQTNKTTYNELKLVDIESNAGLLVDQLVFLELHGNEKWFVVYTYSSIRWFASSRTMFNRWCAHTIENARAIFLISLTCDYIHSMFMFTNVTMRHFQWSMLTLLLLLLLLLLLFLDALFSIL
jgi:hypothetical protein